MKYPDCPCLGECVYIHHSGESTFTALIGQRRRQLRQVHAEEKKNWEMADVSNPDQLTDVHSNAKVPYVPYVVEPNRVKRSSVE